MPKEGQTGTAPDGSQVVFMDGKVRKMNPGGLAEMGGGYLKSLNGRTYRTGPQGGMNQVAGPTQTQIETYAAKSSKINEALQSLDAVDKAIRGVQIGPLGWMKNPNKLSEIQGLNKDLLLRLKEAPYNLGVLNGPDLSVMEEVTGNPAKLKDAVFRKGFEGKLRNVAASLGRTYRNDAGTLKSIGGIPQSSPNLFRAPDSSYTADEWGYNAEVPAARYGGKTGARVAPRSTPAARPALNDIFE